MATDPKAAALRIWPTLLPRVLGFIQKYPQAACYSAGGTHQAINERMRTRWRLRTDEFPGPGTHYEIQIYGTDSYGAQPRTLVLCEVSGEIGRELEDIANAFFRERTARPSPAS